jgi:DNA polymerase-4
LKLCPELIVVSGSHHHYGRVSKQVMERLHDLTPLVEQISIDEAFLDITDLPGDVTRIARGLQTRIRDELDLPSSIGVASNKLVAKIANEVGKKGGRSGQPPFAITVVPAGDEAEFLASLPAEMLWGVGPKTSARLAGLGIHTIGDIARWPEGELVRLFGENGREMAMHARGQDRRPVVTEREIKSISQEITYARDTRDDASIEKTLRKLSAQVGRRLRNKDLAGTTVKLKIRWPDFTTLTRQVTLPHPTDNDLEITEAALKLLHKVRVPKQAVRLIGVGVSRLGPPVRQLELWEHGTEKARRLQAVMDELREKYGEAVIRKGK